MAGRGLYHKNTARFAAGAISALSSVLGEDESLSAKDFLEGLDGLVERWMKLKNGKPETARTYRQRAAGVLADYLRYGEDPLHFKPSFGATQKPSAKPKSSKMSKEAPATVTASEPKSTPAEEQRPNPPTQVMDRDCPLSGGRVFWFRCPEGGLTKADVRRISYHLLTRASDLEDDEAPPIVVTPARAAPRNQELMNGELFEGIER